MSDEAGFELGRAYVVASPDASGFADELDEQLSGISISVAVTPDMSDFASMVDEGIGSLVATVAVTPDLTGFADAVEEQAGGLATSVMVTADTEGLAGLGDQLAQSGTAVALPVTQVPDMSAFQGMLSDTLADLSENVAEGFGGAIPVPVLPDTADFADLLDEKVGGLTVSVRVIPGTEDFAQVLQEQVSDTGVTIPVSPGMQDFQTELDGQVGDEGITIPVTADTSSAVSGLEDLTGAEADASAGASVLGGGLGALDDQFSALQGRLASLDSSFQATASSGTATDEEMQVLGDRMDSLNLAFSAVEGELSSFRDELTADGASAAQAAGQFGLMSSMLTELEGQLSATEGAAETVGTDFDAMASQVAGANERLNAANDTMSTVAATAPAASDAAGGLSGVLEELGSRLSYFAVDPFMWMYAAPMVIEGVASAVQDLGGATEGWLGELTKQDQATGYNVAGYQKLAGQVSVAAGQYAQSARSMTDSTKSWGTDAGAVFSSISEGMTQVSQHASSEASNLAVHLGALESAYNLTTPQAEALAAAAGVSYKQLEGSGTAAQDAMAKIEAYANANTNATGPVGQLSNDMLVFGNDALTASARVSGLDAAYQTLVGNFVGTQQDNLAVAQDFLTIASNAEQAGASMTGTNQASLTLQQSFYSTISAVEQTAESMGHQGDSVSQVTAYYQDQIDKLSVLTGGNQQAAQAVDGLRQLEQAAADSTGGLDQALTQAADHMASQFTAQLKDAGAESSKVKTGVDDLTNSILNNGANSASTENDRAQLIRDLEASGLSAQKATQLVDAFIKKIAQIPTHVNLSITESATGTWSITGNASAGTAEAHVTGAGGRTITQHASGGLIDQGSHIPRADDVHARLSRGEYVVQSDAVDHYGVGMLDAINAKHFDGGGYAGNLAGLASWLGNRAAGDEYTMAQALIASIQAAQGTGQSSGRSPIIVNFNGTQMPTPEQRQAIMSELSALIGVS